MSVAVEGPRKCKSQRLRAKNISPSERHKGMRHGGLDAVNDQNADNLHLLHAFVVERLEKGCHIRPSRSSHGHTLSLEPSCVIALFVSYQKLADFHHPTQVSVSSVTMMAWQFGHVLEISSILVAARQAAQAVVAAVLMNVSIVGINQVYDKKLDRVNKPYLPMASGAFSSDTAISIIAVCTALSFMVGLWSGSSALMWALLISLILGIVYSVDYPGLRWKKSPFLAASCVLFVRAVIVQLGFFAHALGRGLMNFNFPVNLWCAICFMTVYGIVIALFKDLPDMEGDVKQNVRTLSVRLGPSFVFNLCLTLLSVAYVTAIVVNLMHAVSTTSLVVGAVHSIVIITLLAASRQVNVTSSASLYDFYIRFIWRAFYLEYFLLPFFTFV